MDNRPILFLDSGTGGLPYCRHFHVRNPQEALVYVADQEHFPYGPRTEGELTALLTPLIKRLLELFDPKLVVLACNTASVSALSALRDIFPLLPLVGTVPAIKPAVLESRARKVGVLGTDRTIADPYIAELAAQYGPDCALVGLAAPELVEFVEYHFDKAGPEERSTIVQPYIDTLRSSGVDAVVLGCTHFLFLMDEFKGAASPDIRVYGSIDGISRRIENLLDQDKNFLRAQRTETGPQNILGVTGKGDLNPCWKIRADSLGFTLCPLEK